MLLSESSVLSKQKKINIVNAIIFQCCWFLAVLVITEVTLIALAIALIVYFYSLNSVSKNLYFMALTLIVLSLVGYIGDSIIAWQTGLVYSDNIGNLAPVWLLVLWIAFSTTLPFSMTWIFIKPWLTVIIGLCLAPMSYVAGIHLSNSYFIEEGSYPTFFVIEGIWWAILLTSYRKINEIYEGYHEKSIIS